MPYAEPLSDRELTYALQSLPGWEIREAKLSRTFGFPSFAEALAFVGRMGELAEEQEHHPDIDIRYRRVTLSLVTHAAGGRVTERDIRLARAIDEIGPPAAAQSTV